MSPAQKKAQATFKKAIAYRKKTGCTLKQAFAYAKGEKVGAVKKKAVKKAAKKKIVKKAAKKKAPAKSYHKDTASHNVRISVVSGIPKKLLNEIEKLKFDIERHESYFKNHVSALKRKGISKEKRKSLLSDNKQVKNYLLFAKKHLKSLQSQLKKSL